MISKKYFVSVAGNIGSGKSSLTRLISEKLNWIPYFESVSDNPYLEDFYSDMLRWSFNLQIYFLSHRFRIHKEILEQQKRATERQTRSSYLSVIASISTVKALKQALASSTVALEATQAGFEVGTRTAVDVLDSQRELYLAKRNYAQVRYNYVLETLNLKLAAGTLSLLDLEALNPWLK